MNSTTLVTSASIGASVFAVTVDPATYAAAAIMVLAGVSALIVQALNAWAAMKERIEAAKERVIAAAERRELLEKTESTNEKVKTAVTQVEQVATKAMDTAAKIDIIAAVTETTEKNVDGNLSAMREELARQTSHSEALQATVDTLATIIQAQAGATLAAPAVPIK